jgi:RNA polymerase sigma-70 factor, ECF subfamily
MPLTGSTAEAAPDEAAAGAWVLDWSAILPAHEHWLRSVITSRLRERQAVDEVLQEVALAAVAQRAPLLDPRRVIGWLYRLAVRQSLLYRRKAGRQRALVDRYAKARGADAGEPVRSPLAWLVRDERQSLVQQALHRLSPRDADLLVLKYAEGWSARELAERLGMKTATIEARLHRARGRLRSELAALAAEFANDSEEHDHD